MKATGLILASLLLLAGCGEKIESKWTKQALVIDGKAEDEEFPYEYWFKDQRVALSSRALARMLSDQGVVLWFDPGGEKKKAYGVKLVEGKDTIKVMKGKDTSTVPASGKQGPAFAVLNEEGAYNYEIRVPRSAVAAKPGEKIGLGLEFTTMQVKAKKKHRSQMHEGGRGGMGGMGGYGAGRQPMGRPGAGPAPDQGGEKPKIETKLEDKEIWLQLILAEKED
jgi:hypothetical protein